MLSAGTEVIQMARASQDSRADVLVEVTIEAFDDEAHPNDRLLNPERRSRSHRAEGEEDVATSSADRLGGAGEEHACAFDRVRRIGDDGVECTLPSPSGATSGDRAPDRTTGKLALAKPPLDEGDDRGIDVDDADVLDRRFRADLVDEPAQGQRRQVVVPRNRILRPVRAPASWNASTRRSLVSTVQWHWSSSRRGGGA